MPVNFISRDSSCVCEGRCGGERLLCVGTVGFEPSVTLHEMEVSQITPAPGSGAVGLEFEKLTPAVAEQPLGFARCDFEPSICSSCAPERAC